MTTTTEVEPLIRPPRLHLGRAGSASRLELFFDLAYVLVVMQLASAFVDNLTWHGLAVICGLFAAIWTSWVGFTLYANRFDTDDVVFRLAKLLATGAVAGCAASASEATGKLSFWFAASYLVGQVILIVLYLRAWRHVPDARPTIVAYLGSLSVGALLWAISLAVPAPGRFWLWGLAVIISTAGPIFASLRNDKLPLHIEHLPERFGLLVILVLGEAVGGAARGVHDASWAPLPLTIGIVGFVLTAAMWWIYFDVAAASGSRELERQAEDDDTEGGEADERHDLFVYGHFPLALGIILTGIGIEEVVLHPDEVLPSPYGSVLAGGLVVFVIGVAMIIGGTLRSWRAVWPWPLAIVPVLVVLALLPHGYGLLLVGVYAAITIALAARGTLHTRRSTAEQNDAAESDEADTRKANDD